MSFNRIDLKKLDLIVLIIVGVIAVVSIGGDIASSFSILSKPIPYVNYSSFIGINLIAARIVTFICAVIVTVFVILILTASFIHRKDNAPWTMFFLKKDKSKRFIKEIELSLILGLLATVIFAVNATILSFLSYGLVISFWILAFLMIVVSILSVDLFTTYFRRFI